MARLQQHYREKLAPELMADANAFARWQSSQAALRGLTPVAVLVHRYHFLNGGTAWLDAWLQMFADQGLAAYAVFGQQVDVAGLKALLETPAGVHPPRRSRDDSRRGRHRRRWPSGSVRASGRRNRGRAARSG